MNLLMKALFVLVTGIICYTIIVEVQIEKELNKNINADKHPILLFDGVCNLCSGVVDFMLEYDVDEKFKFAALQSDIAHNILDQHGLDNDLSTVVLIDRGRAFTRSTAALRIAKHLPFPINLVYYTAIFVPLPVRDFGYNMVATSRYIVFGKHDECLIPSPELQARFLDSIYDNDEDCENKKNNYI
eukprot:TRINITY_DN1168_c1_g1_i1.p1 TRINITY_DN1168_c1_g1~~TRINITY_DN1168_c1_g1_i1.p1  ORF type:complete len:186 (+),score=51.55 TRINITY_DN1168_c1_g1_i1:116-673(+)